MSAFLMQHAGGVREVSGYTTPRYSVTYARTAERTAGATRAIRVWGDGGALPAELAVTLFVQDDTAELSDAYYLAYDIIAEAETASIVTTHMGAIRVNGLLGHDIRPDGPNALLTLRFAPAFERVYSSLMVASQSATAEKRTVYYASGPPRDGGPVVASGDPVVASGDPVVAGDQMGTGAFASESGTAELGGE